MDQWEYDVVRYKSGEITTKYKADLYHAGLAGWELVSLVPMDAGAGGTYAFVATFKRRLIPQTQQRDS